MAERGEVDADLVRAAGARQDTQERVPVPLGEHGVIRDGRLTVRRGGAAGGAVVRAGDGQVNGAAYRQAGAAGGGEIRAPKAAGEREQVSVLIQDIQRHGHGRELAAGALVIDAHGEGIPCLHAIDGAGVRAVDADAVRHGLDAGNGPVGHAQFTPEQAFDRAASLLRRDGERQPAHSCAASAASYAARVRLSKQTMRTRVISGWSAR